MGFPVTFNNVTYNLSDFSSLAYVTGLPNVLESVAEEGKYELFWEAPGSGFLFAGQIFSDRFDFFSGTNYTNFLASLNVKTPFFVYFQSASPTNYIVVKETSKSSPSIFVDYMADNIFGAKPQTIDGGGCLPLSDNSELAFSGDSGGVTSKYNFSVKERGMPFAQQGLSFYEEFLTAENTAAITNKVTIEELDIATSDVSNHILRGGIAAGAGDIVGSIILTASGDPANNKKGGCAAMYGGSIPYITFGEGDILLMVRFYTQIYSGVDGRVRIGLRGKNSPAEDIFQAFGVGLEIIREEPFAVYTAQGIKQIKSFGTVRIEAAPVDNQTNILYHTVQIYYKASERKVGIKWKKEDYSVGPSLTELFELPINLDDFVTFDVDLLNQTTMWPSISVYHPAVTGSMAAVVSDMYFYNQVWRA